MNGIRVVDLTQHLSGPFCTWTLANLGAEVIKVEAIGHGEGSRETGPMVQGRSMYFDSLNRGKRSIAIDLKNPLGRETCREILKDADVLVENFRPGVLERLGLSESQLKAINPQLIVAHITGFGQAGSLSGRAAYDVIVQAMSGMVSVNGDMGSAGIRVGVSIGDIAAALFATIGIIDRLYERDARAGLAKSLDVSMLACQFACLENAFSRHLNAGDLPRPNGSEHPSIAPFGVYETADGPISIATGNQKDWITLCAVIEAETLTNESCYAGIADRVKHKKELQKDLNRYLARDSRENWVTKLAAAGLAVGEVNTVEQAAASLLDSTGSISNIEHEGRNWAFVKHPLREPHAGAEPPAPNVGEHTRQILGECGYTPSQIDDLYAAGAIG